MSSDDALPAVRSVEVVPFRANEQVRFVLRDASGIAPRPLALSLAAYFVLAHLDGQNTCGDIQRAFWRQFGQLLAADQIESLVAALDQALLLRNDRFETAYRASCEAYRRSEVRDNRQRWPDATALRGEISTMLAAGSAPPVRELRGLIAPHLDYARGGPCYADAYAALARTPAVERFVILGTNHFGRCSAVVATGKDFVTPLGRVATDRGLIERVEHRLGRSIREDEFDHASEHSIELQVHILQTMHPSATFEIVPILCPDPSGPTGTQPRNGDGPDLDEFIEALRLELDRDGRPTILIASADLSHVGRHFGDANPTTDAFLAEVERSDRALLGLLEDHREQDFLARIAARQNATRICSVGCLYALRRALPDAPVRLLRYHQAVNRQAEMHVSCAAGVVGRVATFPHSQAP